MDKTTAAEGYPPADPPPPPIENQKSKIENDQATGLPLLSTWPRLYTFILLFFALSVLALLWLSRAFA